MKLWKIKWWLYRKFTWLWDSTPGFMHAPIDWLRDLTYVHDGEMVEVAKHVWGDACTMEKVEVLGMPLERWRYKSAEAVIAVFDDEKAATLYNIESKEPGRGHATGLLRKAKTYYERKGYNFGGTVALNDAMKNIYKQLGIKEYD